MALEEDGSQSAAADFLGDDGKLHVLFYGEFTSVVEDTNYSVLASMGLMSKRGRSHDAKTFDHVAQSVKQIILHQSKMPRHLSHRQILSNIYSTF